MKRSSVIAGVVLIVSTSATASAEHPQSKTVRVDCAHGETIGGALAADVDDKAPLVVEFTGTCEEVVMVPRDDVTIRGGDPTATLVGRIVVDGKVRPRLSSFTIRDTPPDPDPNGRLGDAVTFNASLGAVVEELRIIHPGGNGITVDSAQVKIHNVTVTDCGVHGVASGLSGSMIVSGTLVTNRCLGAGIQVGFGSQMSLAFDTVIETNDNFNWGILVQTQGQFTIFRGSQITALRNGIGIQVANKGSLTYDDCRMDISNSRGFGILVGELSDWTPFGGAHPNITISGNGGAGIAVIRRAFVRMREGTVVSGNRGPGLLVDDSDIAFRDTTIQGNAFGDVLLFFGSTASFDGPNTFGTIVCDGTVLVRGTAACPTTAAATAAQQSLVGRLRAEALSAMP